MAELKNYTDATPFDTIANYVYIIDLHDYEMLYMNKLARKNFGMSETDYAGKKCYEVLHNLTEPCIFCGAAGMDMSRPCYWKTHNKPLNEYHQVRDVPLLFRGHEARMEMSIDVTSYVQQQQSLKEALDMETAMLEAIRILNNGADMAVALDKMLAYLGMCFGASRVYVYELQDGVFVDTYEWRSFGNDSKLTKGHAVYLRQISGFIEKFRNHKAVCVPDVAKANEEEYLIGKEGGVKSYAMAPLFIEGRLIGFFGMDDPAVENLKTLSVTLMALACFTSIMMANAENRNALELLSYTDSMTEVANRNAYTRDVHQYKQMIALRPMPVGVIYFDLNGLKAVNDTHGHEAGDALIKELASELTGVFRRTEVYRIGGDEFVVLIVGIGEAEFAKRLATVKAHIGDNKKISVSIGSNWSKDGEDFDELISSADNAMYEEKQHYYEGKKKR